jgi:alpha-glucosidase
MEKDWLWWKHGVIYQIYPRSFKDTNNDGIGDIPGIIEKLDYLQELGIDAIWISPINVSPMFDFGYDVSDYRKIDPVFGTSDDFDRLIKEAKKRGIRMIMDLVVNHTSHQHPWFLESRSSRNNPKRDWYIWHDGKNGKPPNNWLAAFGGKGWEWDEKTQQFYYHAFLKEQPDLNWMNPKVRDAVLKEFSYWLDKGIDGFRLDVVNFYVKDSQFRSNPFGIGPTPRPYDLQKHIYDRNRPELHEIMKDFRSLFDEYYERMMVGETYNPPPGDPAYSAEYLGKGDDELHLAFDFSLIFIKSWSAKIYKKLVSRWYSFIPDKGWPAFVLSNHDQPRTASRLGGGNDKYKRAKVLAAMIMTLKGTPFIYYGEEIGMVDGKLKKEEICDPLGIKYWPFVAGRDIYRTPMQWNSDFNAGFSSAKPWLPVNNDFGTINVEAEKIDSLSVLNFYKILISLRRKHPALYRGEWIPVVEGEKNLFAYYRTCETETLFILLNFSRLSDELAAEDSSEWEVLFSTHKKLREHFTGLNFKAHPYEVTILKRTKSC